MPCNTLSIIYSYSKSKSRIDAVEFAREMLNVDAIRHRTLFHGARGCLALRCLPVGPTIPLKMSLSAAHGADPVSSLPFSRHSQ